MVLNDSASATHRKYHTSYRCNARNLKYDSGIDYIRMEKSKFVDSQTALKTVKDGSTIAVSGFNHAIAPEYLLKELYRMYIYTGHPRHLFFEFETTPGIPGSGIDSIANELYQNEDHEFIKGMLIPYTGFSPWSAKLIQENRIEGYMWSIGTVSYWFREVSCSRPGLITKVGIDTFTDPRDPVYHGGLMNEKARKAMRARVSVVTLDGEEYLFYQAPKPNVALIRGTTADEIGDISVDEEGMITTILNIAQAAKSKPDRGTVIAQIKRITRFGSRSPKLVIVPGPLIDYLVLAPESDHWQSGSFQYNPAIVGEDFIPNMDEMVRSLTKNMNPIQAVIARRSALELARYISTVKRSIIINLGVGIPVYVSTVIAQEGVRDYITTTIEPGSWGGIALSGNDFGVALSPYAMLHMPDQFATYEGGILDAAVLGFMQVDRHGNVNSSYIPNRVFTGPGGFPVISRGASLVIFAGRFMGGEQEETIRDGRLVIESEGTERKFVKDLYMRLFSGRESQKQKQTAIYVTERAVFKLMSKGLEIVEIAPGVDLEKDVLKNMEFEPLVPKEIPQMDPRIFDINSPLGLSEMIGKNDGQSA